MDATIKLSGEQYSQLVNKLNEFKTANESLIQKLQDKAVMERKVFGIMKKVKSKILGENGQVDTIKALQLFTDDEERTKFMNEISELQEILNYYEKNAIQIL